MSGFGGAVKLTGESEYRRALQQITQNLREVSSQMKVVSTSFASNDKSIQALTAKEEVLNQKLTEQTNKLNILKSQYASMSSQYSDQTAKHNALINTYNSEKQKLDEIGRTLGTTSKEYQEQKAKVADLEKEVIQSTKAQDANEKSMSKMREQINLAQADCNKTAREIDNLGKETEEAGREAEHASEGFTIFKGIVANLASSAIQSAISGLKRLGTSLVNVGKQAYGSYAEYEQLVGGVETLFGESAETVQNYAKNAYKTAGMSANTYMETVTSFSASLLQGLGGDTAKSAEIANMAIIDMSDNANKMGTSIESIQNAYQAFAKQNYTLLDNLKLGYGGTKTEMLRLVKDAGVVEQSLKSLDNVSFAQMIEAIHIIQQRIGITGTTAQEAGSTIEGSTKSVKASWENLLVSIADGNADLGKSIKEFTDNAMIMVQNSVPRIKQIIKGMWAGIKELIRQFMPDIYEQVVPVLDKIMTAVKNIGKFIIDNFSTITTIVLGLASAFVVLGTAVAISKTVQAVATAIQGFTVATQIATQAMAGLNAIMSANPFGAFALAVTALIGVLVLLTQIETEAEKQHHAEMEELKKQNDAIMENVNSWEQLKEARQNELNQSMSSLSHYEALYRELQLITDENGKVQKGYESRAEFITNELASALGIEISMVDGVIQNYDTLIETIDKTIEKKRAQIILDSQESMYREAIAKQEEALHNLNIAQDEYLAKKAEADELERQFAEAQIALTEARTQSEQDNARYRLETIRAEMEAKNDELAFASANYAEQENLLNQYAYNIAQYENNMALMHEERYGEMSTVNWDYVQELQDADDQQEQMLRDRMENEQKHLQILKDLKKKFGTDMFDDQIRQSEETLDANRQALNDYKNATSSALDETEIIWKRGLDKQLSDITGSNIEFKTAGQGQVQMYVDGVATGEPKSTAEMAKIVTKTINEISKRTTDSEIAGQNLIWGVNNGIANQSVQSSAFNSVANFGYTLLARLKASLAEQSPSKATNEMGQFLLKGLQGGIKDQEKQTIRDATTVGQHVIEALNSELSQGATMGSINASNAKGSAYTGMVDAFKEALGEMKIELDGDVAGEFVDRTVTKLVFG